MEAFIDAITTAFTLERVVTAAVTLGLIILTHIRSRIGRQSNPAPDRDSNPSGSVTKIKIINNVRGCRRIRSKNIRARRKLARSRDVDCDKEG